MDKNKQLAGILKQMFDSGAVTVVRGTLDDNGNVAIPLPVEIDQPLPTLITPTRLLRISSSSHLLAWRSGQSLIRRPAATSTSALRKSRPTRI
jgi:hypothetical protein